LPSVVVVSQHYLESRRQAGMHFLARAFRGAGWDVLFLTVGISWVSRLRRDHRFAYPVLQEANRVKEVEPGLASFVWLRPWHPVDLRFRIANVLARPLFRTYGNARLGEAEPLIRGADVVLFESTSGIMLFDQIKRLNPDARFVYRVADDLRVIGTSPVVLDAEVSAAPRFDLISVSGRVLLGRFAGCDNVIFHRHGIEKSVFDRESDDPYRNIPGCHAVSIGGTLFDLDALLAAGELYPDWTFHVFGWTHGDLRRANIRVYSEIPFEKTIPYLKHADVGLALYRYQRGAEYLADSSLKMIQYTYCRLPIVAPEFAKAPEWRHVFGYRSGDRDSIRMALERARGYDRDMIDRSAIRSWDELVSELAG